MYTCRIELAPVPAARPKVPRNGRPYYPKTYAAWREEAAALISYDGEPMAGPLAARIRMVCKRPQRPKDCIPRGDVDNFAKAVMDALTAAGAWGDDVQVVDLRITKRYAEKGEMPHSIVSIEEAKDGWDN